VFFSIASSIANMDGLKRFGKIMSSMAGTFLFTSIIAAIFMIIVVKVFPPAQGVVLELTRPDKVENISNRSCCFSISWNSNGCYSWRRYDW